MEKVTMLRGLSIGISRILSLISKWPAFLAVLAMAATVIVGVTARYVFNSPLPFVDEYNGYFMVAVVLLPLSWVLRDAGHIRINILVNALPRRAAHYLELATTIISLGIVIVLIIGTTQVVITSFARGVRAWTLMGTPLGPVQLIMLIGLILFAIQLLTEIVRSLKAQRHTG